MNGARGTNSSGRCTQSAPPVPGYLLLTLCACILHGGGGNSPGVNTSAGIWLDPNTARLFEAIGTGAWQELILHKEDFSISYPGQTIDISFVDDD